MTTTSMTSGPSRTTRAVWIGLGAFFAALTARVLLWDVGSIRQLTPEHLLTVGAIIGAIASGLYFWPMLRACKLGNATGLGIAFVAATVYCLIGSAGRGDEQSALKNEAVTLAQDARERAQRTREEAQARYDRALEEELFECRTGKGSRCKSLRELTPQRRADLELAEATLKSLKPAGQVNGKLQRAAELLAFFVTGDKATAEQGLALIWPFIPPLVCELLTIVFLHLGFSGTGHTARKPKIEAQDAGKPTETEETEPRQLTATRKPNGGNRVGRMSKLETERFVTTELALGRRFPSQDFLAAKTGVGKGTISKWMVEWESKGLICKARVGKCNVIEAA